MAVSSSGIVHHLIKNTSESGVKGDDFTEFITDLCMKLPPNTRSILVMDNAQIHHCGDVEQLFDELSIPVLYLPPYSPDYNPIEKCFGIMKQHVRGSQTDS